MNINIPNQPKKIQSSADAFWFLLLLLALLLIFVFILQFAWNATMPHIFGLKQINFFQALLLLILVRMLLPWGPNLNFFNYDNLI